MNMISKALSLGIFVAAQLLSQNPIRFTQVAVPNGNGIGIDYQSTSECLVVSLGYNNGGYPYNLARLSSTGSLTNYSSLSGLTDELKIATVKSGQGGFQVGDVFSGNGLDGQIVRVSAAGVPTNPWCVLPGSGNGLMRGSITHDTTGSFGGDLLVVTTAGKIWRITSSASATLLASLPTHLEGACVVPNDPARYGVLSGNLLVGAEAVGLLYVVTPAGAITSYSLGVAVEDIDLIDPDSMFYGMNHGTGYILGAPASTFRGMEGDILLTQENPNGCSLWRLQVNGSQLSVVPFALAVGSAPVAQWEHVTFAPIGIAPFPSCTVQPARLLEVGVGQTLTFSVTAQDVDPAQAVSIAAFRLPPGIQTQGGGANPGNPALVNYVWAPSLAEVGHHVAVFTATDSTGLETTCRVEIEVRVLPGSIQWLGTGCAGSAGPPYLVNVAGTLPRIGQVLRLRTGNLPGNAGALLLWGSDPWALPGLDLGAFGMPGCSLFTYGSSSGLTASLGGFADWSIAIPNTQGLSGYRLFLQSLVFDPPANAAGMTLSNGALSTLGY